MAGSRTSTTGWALLHSDVPAEAIKSLSNTVYGVGGLSDVNEAYLIERLHQSELAWSWIVDEAAYLGFEDRTPQGKNYTLRYYLASARGTLEIETEKASGVFRRYSGVGASDNRKLDASFKGAATVALKNAMKTAGLTLSVYKDGKSVDVIYENADGTSSTGHVGDEERSVAPESGGVHPAARRNAAAADAKEAETKPEAEKKSPISKPQQQTLLYLMNFLPTVAKQAEDGVVEGERNWNKVRLADGIRAYEARQAGSGFSGVFKALEKEHLKECGDDCVHLKQARESDGFKEQAA